MEPSEAYQKIKAYGQNTALEIKYLIGSERRKLECTAHGYCGALDATTLTFITNREEGLKDVIGLERIVSIKQSDDVRDVA